ncbi:hypothetical protein BGX34_001567 [Mortierella sp. NVP85]|nr:hypothetical protein BGX34_001567 [Mortierella sp. NVP85]
MEIKSPKQAHNGRQQLEDLWKLAVLCKDNIDNHVANHRDIRQMAAVRVFGHQLSVFSMELKNGFYHWAEIGSCNLPVDRTDGCRVLPCLELLRTLERYLDNIGNFAMASMGVRGEPKPTVLSPTKRPFF